MQPMLSNRGIIFYRNISKREYATERIFTEGIGKKWIRNSER
jgi:hypothetical protein